mmetsp:Transcript_23807/g.37644  ORF Transcript_23807/g.37644 Transcript_23807/m.37644 type:complete len:286 (+) Transcript_23807:1283-2140(+)
MDQEDLHEPHHGRAAQPGRRRRGEPPAEERARDRGDPGEHRPRERGGPGGGAVPRGPRGRAAGRRPRPPRVRGAQGAPKLRPGRVRVLHGAVHHGEGGVPAALQGLRLRLRRPGRHARGQLPQLAAVLHALRQRQQPGPGRRPLRLLLPEVRHPDGPRGRGLVAGGASRGHGHWDHPHLRPGGGERPDGDPDRDGQGHGCAGGHLHGHREQRQPEPHHGRDQRGRGVLREHRGQLGGRRHGCGRVHAGQASGTGQCWLGAGIKKCGFKHKLFSGHMECDICNRHR